MNGTGIQALFRNIVSFFEPLQKNFGCRNYLYTHELLSRTSAAGDVSRFALNANEPADPRKRTSGRRVEFPPVMHRAERKNDRLQELILSYDSSDGTDRGSRR